MNSVFRADPEMEFVNSIDKLTHSQIEDLSKLERRKFNTREARNEFERSLRNAGYMFQPTTTKNRTTQLWSTEPVALA